MRVSEITYAKNSNTKMGDNLIFLNLISDFKDFQVF